MSDNRDRLNQSLMLGIIFFPPNVNKNLLL